MTDIEEKLRKKKEEEEAMWGEYIEQRKKQRAKEEEELKKLKDRQVCIAIHCHFFVTSSHYLLKKWLTVSFFNFIHRPSVKRNVPSKKSSFWKWSANKKSKSNVKLYVLVIYAHNLVSEILSMSFFPSHQNTFYCHSLHRLCISVCVGVVGGEETTRCWS